MRKFAILVVLALGLVVGACGGSSGGGSTADPVGAVNSLINAVVAKQSDKIPPLLCTAKRDDLTKKFDLTAALAAAPSGVDMKSIISSMTITTKDLAVTQKSATADAAVVHVKGTLLMNMPDDKLKEYIKTLMSQSGQTPTDDQVSQMVTTFKDQLTKGQAMDSDVDVVKEGSTWLVCGDFTTTPG